MLHKASKVPFLAVALVAMLLVSFGVMAQSSPVTVKLWMHVHPPRIPLDQELLANFAKDNPDINVEYTTVPGAEWNTTLNTGLASGAGPDLFNADSFSIGDFYNQGTIVPVDPAAAGYADQQSIYDAYAAGNSLLAGATFGDKLYGLPTELSAYACYTNNALWEKAGLDPDKDFPKTWEDMKTVAEKLTVRDANGAITQRGFDFKWDASIFMLLIFNPMVEQAGGEMINENDYTANINTPEVKKVLSYYNDWVNTWKLGGPQYTEIRSAFLAGEVATDCDLGNWGAPQVEDAKIEYTVHAVPRWADGVNDRGFANYAYFFMVNSQAAPDVQAAAWKVAGYMTSFPDRYLATAGLFQAKKDFVESDTFKADKLMPLFLQEQSKNTYHPRIAGFFEVADALMRARDRVITGGEDMDTVLADAQTEVNDILANAKAGITVTPAASS